MSSFGKMHNELAPANLCCAQIAEKIPQAEYFFKNY
jgi:hypothetical protein